MGRLVIYNFITLNGFYKGPGEDISWHRHGAEEAAFAAESMSAAPVTLLFGRVTYEMMSGFWSSPMGMQNNPAVAEGMNKAEKIVFSRTLKTADWNNTKLISENIIEAMRKLKQTSPNDMTVLGSGSIVAQFAEHDLIDEYQLMIDPVAVGSGTTLFHNINRKLELKLTKCKTFSSGVVLVSYEPVR